MGIGQWAMGNGHWAGEVHKSSFYSPFPFPPLQIPTINYPLTPNPYPVIVADLAILEEKLKV
ncbi:hypothetical protein H6G81_24540 [Scytonema hofmannii FACHB-248]|uniref:Uncharacterized protein n=1 Tax=Scytonema hofmannii FACHB-248 TaxID=1842502 RepID=A0ABR8GX11_9CYAN|nr:MULTISPECIES: hypothetical protein [Nostocales]MBD2607606.1 hypothetical protein [Scytonema hofmannii FACHB-248]